MYQLDIDDIKKQDFQWLWLIINEKCVSRDGRYEYRNTPTDGMYCQIVKNHDDTISAIMLGEDRSLVLSYKEYGSKWVAYKTELDAKGSSEIKRFADYVSGKIAGHSDYRGDNILSALAVAATGKEIQDVKPLEYKPEKSDKQKYIDLSVLKLLTVAAVCYIETRRKMEKRMSESKDILDLYMTCPNVQMTTNLFALDALAESHIDCNKFTQIEDVEKTMPNYIDYLTKYYIQETKKGNRP